MKKHTSDIRFKAQNFFVSLSAKTTDVQKEICERKAQINIRALDYPTATTVLPHFHAFFSLIPKLRQSHSIIVKTQNHLVWVVSILMNMVGVRNYIHYNYASINFCLTYSFCILEEKSDIAINN